MKDFEEYKKQCEPNKKEKSEIWETAIGLQEVDGLKPSAYLIDIAKANIEGDITFEEVKNNLNTYYKSKPNIEQEHQTEEADKVSARIAEILAEKTFKFSPMEYIVIHKRLFEGIYKFAGKIRDYNITKEEWVLDNDTVYYASCESIRATLDYDFEQERKFNYQGLDKAKIVEHFVDFVSNLWQIHAFGEGNTRTTAVFAIKYLRTMGFSVNNNLFVNNSWYFRNALVRANYNNYEKQIYATNKYLIAFFENLLLNKNNILKNRELHINYIVNTKDEAINEAINSNEAINEAIKNKKLSTTLIKLLTIINDNPGIKITKLQEELKLSRATVQRQLKQLVDMGLVVYNGSNKTGGYFVTLNEDNRI